MAASNLSVGLALLAGMVTVLSPCVLPILPILVGRSLQSHRYGPLAIVAGLVGGFALAGSLLGIAATWFSQLATTLRAIAIAFLFVMGLLAVFPKWSYQLFSYIPINALIKQPQQRGLMGEFWLGTQLGLLWTPCAGHVLASILVLAAVHHQALGAFMLLLCYGIGAALPMLAIAYGGRYLSHRLLSLRSKAINIQRIGGIMIVGTAIAILFGWDVQLQLWLAPLFPSVQI
jgi:cytochrome c-type biogenesis protein